MCYFVYCIVLFCIVYCVLYYHCHRVHTHLQLIIIIIIIKSVIVTETIYCKSQTDNYLNTDNTIFLRVAHQFYLIHYDLCPVLE
jgi:hypothetical protein